MNVTVNNRNNPEYEAMLDNLIQEIFGFSFSPWFKRKLWNSDYESYSIIESGKMLSNVCIFKSELLINGKKTTAIQFGAVATRKSERGKGMSRIIMGHVLSLYPSTPAYLFANQGVLEFYPKFDFVQVQTYKPEISFTIDNNAAAAVKCNVDDEIVTRALDRRNVYSSILDCTNSMPIQQFHLIMPYSNNIYYLPNCDTLVVAEKKDSRLFIVDVMAQNPVTFETIARELPFDGIKIVEFGFCPDWLGVSLNWNPANMTADPFFIKGDWNLPKEFCFPLTSTT
ncbi:MAG: GNAT family N-acetyltransferase [Firmicutes bacterium]|nr:GNAT family N-acetyltransferase [Bacillota bacterium]